MARGSLRLNTKQDDARTLMLKIDARATYAGRERAAAHELEGKRQVEHIEANRHLFNADMNRSRREIQRRRDILESLQQQNKERRTKREVAWCEEEEGEWEKRARAARRRRTLPKIHILKNHKAEAIGSIRREQQREFTNKIAEGNRLNWSMNALSNSYAKHIALTKQNEQLERVEDLPDVDTDEPKLKTNVNLPKIAVTTNSVVGTHCKKPGIVRLQNIVAGRPRNKVITGADQQETAVNNPQLNVRNKLNAQRNVYVKTGLDRQRTVVEKQMRTVTLDRFERRDLNDSTTELPSKHHRPHALGAQKTVPLRFYELADNPFLRELGLPPMVYRSGDLIGADKPDEMYVWLGFESEEEFERLKEEKGLLMENENEQEDNALQ